MSQGISSQEFSTQPTSTQETDNTCTVNTPLVEARRSAASDRSDNVRKLDWHFRTQLAYRDSLLAEIAREDVLIKQYQDDIEKDEALITEREKRLEATNTGLKDRAEKRALKQQQVDFMRQQNIQIEMELDAKLKKIEEKKEFLESLKQNLPPILEDQKEQLKRKQESLQELRLAFGLEPMLGDQKRMEDE